jgi:PleD family two-component response regulator
MSVSAQEFQILVVDDSRLYRKLVEETLAREQYAVCFGKNGREASDLLAAQRPAVVITDCEMPDITGVELCGQIRRNPSSYTYIILLTGNTDKDQIMTGLSAGDDDYLTKPFQSGELLARVAVGRRIVELYREIQVKNRLLEDLALKDSLTGLPNRRAIEDWAERQLSGAARQGFPFGS